MSDWNTKIIEEFHENNGEAGQFGRSLVLLTTTGAKSGASRVTPMMYFRDGDGDDKTVYVVASKAGAPENPAWFHNLVAHPDVHVERATPDGIVEYDATAETITGTERDRLYADVVVKAAPGFGDYEKKTSRVIPIVALRQK